MQAHTCGAVWLMGWDTSELGMSKWLVSAYVARRVQRMVWYDGDPSVDVVAASLSKVQRHSERHSHSGLAPRDEKSAQSLLLFLQPDHSDTVTQKATQHVLRPSGTVRRHAHGAAAEVLALHVLVSTLGAQASRHKAIEQPCTCWSVHPQS